MEVVGKIIQVLPEQSGIGKNGNPWKVQPYVLETLDQYPRKVHFEVFGEDRIKQNPCAIDELVTVSFDIESREFNGRWYTSIRAWRIQQGDTTQQAAQPAPAAAPAATAPAAAPQAAAQPMESMGAANVDPFDASAADGTSDLPF
ncbi:MAG: DUF3127 domain-containing protein [Paludibacteraceae bacterium]|nr:DUF3127 domain-containing protein [Paludibacteraceae bacterium]MBQ9295731.1 DUF3127 domain-containing protein [Paludibacteraceae bacterium]